MLLLTGNKILRQRDSTLVKVLDKHFAKAGNTLGEMLDEKNLHWICSHYKVDDHKGPAPLNGRF